MTEKTRIGMVLAMIFIVGFGVLLTELRQPEKPIEEEANVSIDNRYISTDLPAPARHPDPAVVPDVRRHRPVARRYVPVRQTAQRQAPARQEYVRPVPERRRPVIELNKATIRTVAQRPQPHREMTPEQFQRQVRRQRPVRKAQYYTVKRGDNLRKIAQRTMNNKAAWKKIYQANRDKLDSPNMIDVGMKLKIPNGI